jgi:hypothetical protein
MTTETLTTETTQKDLDTSVIPKGDYCYQWEEVPSSENNFRGKIKRCPYYTHKTLNGVSVPWCVFLNCGGIDNAHDDSQIQSLVEHFGTEEKMDEALPLFLLWDEVKECGINEGEDFEGENEVLNNNPIASHLVVNPDGYKL